LATGATDNYWQTQALPSVYKHALLQRYVPVFAGKTGSTHRAVVVVDGYAGRGRLADGTPGSAELLLRTAENQAQNVEWRCLLFERDRRSYGSLSQIVGEYAGRGVKVVARHADVAEHLDDIATAAAGIPLFLFLDPCGLGLPYQTLVSLLTQPSRTGLPTEMLLNFSMEAVRRIGGHVASEKGDQHTLRRLDDSVGGTWWREHFANGERNPEAVVAGFASRLSDDTKFGTVAVPVRRAPHHQPVYYLVFATRSAHGFWGFSDGAARAGDEWRKEAQERGRHQPALFQVEQDMSLSDFDRLAEPDLADNILALLETKEQFTVLDHPVGILGEHFGEVRNTAVRAAIKSLHRQGKTPSTGVGPKVERLVVRRPE